MKNFKSVSLFLLILFAFNSFNLFAQEDIGNEYRITLFPSHKVTEKIGGFGYLGYVHTKDVASDLGRSYRSIYRK
jgi:hypothetical protein